MRRLMPNLLSKYKKVLILLAILLAAIFYTTRHAIPILKQVIFGVNDICTADAKRCLTLKPYWFTSNFLNSNSSISAVKRSSFFSVKDIHKDFSNSLLISFNNSSEEFKNAARTDYSSIKKYDWGTVITLGAEFHVKTVNKFAIFGDFYFIPEIQGIVNCKDISCLDDIVNISIDKSRDEHK